MIPLDEVLEALDLSRAQPGIGLLEALFTRFNSRVPFETVSKIERDAAVADPVEKPRLPELFWREHLDSGTGGTCFARVAAFQAVLDALGFSSRRILGRVVSDFDHAALLVELPGRRVICDVGFPFPALLAAAPGETETALGLVRLCPTPRGLLADLGGVPEGPRQVELFLAEVPEADFARIWRSTFRPDAKFLSAVSLRRQFANRAVSFAHGEIRVDDLHSRLTVPLPEARAARLSEVFEVGADRVRRALERVGDPEPLVSDATLTAYLETDREPGDAFSAIASAAGYGRLLEGMGQVFLSEESADRWVFQLSAPEAGTEGLPGSLQEGVTVDSSQAMLRIERRSGATRAESFFQAQARNGKAYLLRGARLSGPRMDLLRNDSLRGRLAGTLAVDLLAWARMLGR
jgi:hypothetical protein